MILSFPSNTVPCTVQCTMYMYTFYSRARGSSRDLNAQCCTFERPLSWILSSDVFNPHLRGCVHIWYSNFKWLFLLKFLCTKILKQLVLPLQSIVFIHMFLNLWHNYAFISFKVHFLNSEIEYHICTQGVA